METNNLKPALMTPPATMNFINKNGEGVSRDLAAIILEYNSWNEEDKKARARERKKQTENVKLI